MDFFFRVPRWLFSGLLSVTFVATGMMIYLETSFRYSDQSGAFSSWIIDNADLIIASTITTLTFTFAWLTAAVLKSARERKTSRLLLLPFLPALLFQIVCAAFILHAVLLEAILPTPFDDDLGRLLIAGDLDEVLYVGLASSVISLPIAAFTIVKLIKERAVDWLRIPLSLLFLPVGILWLQPRLQALTARKVADRPEDHFVG